MISHPVFHDFVKSLLHRDYEQVYELCKEIPKLNGSNLFKKGAYVLSNADQEVIVHPTFRKIGKTDALWFFTTTRDQYPKSEKFIVLHEVKTGSYNVDEVFRKYYSYSNSQIWIWAWHAHHLRNEIRNKKIQRSVRQPDLEYLLPMCMAYIAWFAESLDGATGEVR